MRAAAAALLALPASALVAPHPRLRAPRVLRSAPAAAPPTADSPPRCAVVAAEVADGGKAVDVSYSSGARIAARRARGCLALFFFVRAQK